MVPLRVGDRARIGGPGNLRLELLHLRLEHLFVSDADGQRDLDGGRRGEGGGWAGSRESLGRLIPDRPDPIVCRRTGRLQMLGRDPAGVEFLRGGGDLEALGCDLLLRRCQRGPLRDGRGLTAPAAIKARRVSFSGWRRRAERPRSRAYPYEGRRPLRPEPFQAQPGSRRSRYRGYGLGLACRCRRLGSRRGRCRNCGVAGTVAGVVAGGVEGIPRPQARRPHRHVPSGPGRRR